MPGPLPIRDMDRELPGETGIMKGPQEIAGLLASRSLGKTSRMAPPIRGWVLSRSWENDCCCQSGDSFPHGVIPHRTPDLSEEDARIGWKQKALLIFYLFPLEHQGKADHRSIEHEWN